MSEAADVDIHLSISSLFSLKNVLFLIGVGMTSFYAVVCGLKYGCKKLEDHAGRWQLKVAKKHGDKSMAKGEKDKVVLHHYMRSIVTPSPSPFDLKLETYLRMAKIPYENDFEASFTPENQSPWIAINDNKITGAQSCVEFLAKKFEKDFSSHLSPMEKATARAFQAVCEDHLSWVLVLWRFEYTKGRTMSLLSPLLPGYSVLSESRAWKRKATAHEISRHTKEEVTKIAENDLRSLSLYLGSKPYFTGDKPTEVDCAMFGTLAEIVWTTPNSFMEKLVNGEVVNLKQFCERMKAEFWPDWNECLFASHFR